MLKKAQKPLRLIAAQKRPHLSAGIFGILALGLLCSAASLAQTADTYRQKALELSRNKSWDQAIDNYRKALALEPNDADTHYNLALTLKYKGDSKAAIEEFETAARLRPKWAEAHYGLGAA